MLTKIIPSDKSKNITRDYLTLLPLNEMINIETIPPLSSFVALEADIMLQASLTRLGSVFALLSQDISM